MLDDNSLPVEASQDAPVVTEESSTPEVQESAAPEATEDKKSKGVQKRIDELTANWRNEQREKEWLRQQYEMLQKQVQPQQQEQPKQPKAEGAPNIDDFADVNEYVRHMVAWEMSQAETAREAKEREKREKEQQQQLATKANEAIGKARQKYADFDEVVLQNTEVPISEYAAQAMAEMENGMDVAYHLGKNPAEASRIASLPPYRQLVELGKIEAAISVKKVTSAPPPVGSQLAGTAGGGEPKDIKEWMAWRNAQLSNRQK